MTEQGKVQQLQPNVGVEQKEEAKMLTFMVTEFEFKVILNRLGGLSINEGIELYTRLLNQFRQQQMMAANQLKMKTQGQGKEDQQSGMEEEYEDEDEGGNGTQNMTNGNYGGGVKNRKRRRR